jgi:general secretion pathway protein D
MKFTKLILIGLLLLSTLHAKEQVNINFSNLEIDEFIRLVGKLTNKNILITQKISGTVDMVSSSPVYDTELMEILISVLESKGFTMVNNGSIYEIVRSNEAAKNVYGIAKEGKKLNGSLMTTQVIKVHGENVDVIAAKIRYLISTAAKLMTMKESNTILVTDYPKNIETIKQVIGEIDTKNSAIVKIVPIKYAEIKKLQVKLSDVAKSLFNEKVDGELVKVIIDENTNSLLLIGTQENISKLELLIAKIDIESTAKAVQIFILKNSDAKAVVTSLNEIISKQTFADPSLKPNISASDEINGVIAVGDPSVISGIKLIIDELDKEKFQVYVKARIVEINKNEAQNIGIKYGFAAGDVSSSGLYAMSANFGDASLSNMASTSVLNYLGDIGGTARKAFALGATLDFLESNGASKSISNPSILCVNNQESSIYVGKTISVNSGATAVAGQTTTSYKREDVGLTLKIKPRVSAGDKVTLTVEAILENVLDDGSNNATGQPITSKQEVKTQAILRHGEDIIIGGLVKNYELKSTSKIPLLGDIPWIGKWLFSSNTTTYEQDNLVVILTPYIIDKSEKLSLLQQELGVLTRMQKEYNDRVFKMIENGDTADTNDSSITSEEE